MRYDVDVKGKQIQASSIKRLIIRGDSADVIRFLIPRMWAGQDLYAGTIYVRYELPSGNGDMVTLAKSLNHRNDLIHADWTPNEGATSEDGTLKLSLQVNFGDKMWQTSYIKVGVQKRLDPESFEFEPEVLDAHLVLVQVLVEEAEGYRDDAAEAKDLAETARDDILNNLGFQAVAADLTGDNYIGVVAADIVDIGTVATNIGAVTTAATNIEAIQAAPQAAVDAAAAKEKAEEWAENPENVPVEEGQYSALHHSTKAEQHAGDADDARVAAEGARDDILDDPGVQTVAADLLGDDTIGAVAAEIDDVKKVGSNIHHVKTVAASDAAVTVIGADLLGPNHIEQVSNRYEDIQHVGEHTQEIEDVAGKLVEIKDVSDNMQDVQDVAAAKDNVGVVAGAVANVNIVGNNIAHVVEASEEMAAIKAAPGAAQDAWEAKEAAEALYGDMEAIDQAVEDAQYAASSAQRFLAARAQRRTTPLGYHLLEGQYNHFSIGDIEIPEGSTIEVGEGATWYVIPA